MTVSDWFPQRNNVGDNALCFKRPEMGSNTSEPNLHFIGNAYTPRLPDMVIGFLQISIRKYALSATTLHGLTDESSDLAVHLCSNLLRVFFTGVWIIFFEFATIKIRHGNLVYMTWSTCPGRAVKLIRADFDQ